MREGGQIVNLPPPSGQPPPEVPRHLDLRGLSAATSTSTTSIAPATSTSAVRGLNIELSEIRDRLGIGAGGTIEA